MNTTIANKPYGGLLVGNLIGLLLLIGLFVYSADYLYQALREPELVESQDRLRELVERTLEQGDVFYIRLRNVTLTPTDYEAIGLRDDKQYTANPYFQLALEKESILVMAEADEDGLEIVGPLQRLSSPVDREVYEALLKDAQRLAPDRAVALAPVVLNGAAAYQMPAWLLLIVGLPILLLCTFNLIRATRRWSHRLTSLGS